MQRAEGLVTAGLGAVVGGVIGALVTFWLVGSPSPKVEKEKAVASASPADSDTDVEERLAALESSVARLRGNSNLRSLMAKQAASGTPGAPAAPAPAPSGSDSAGGGDPVIDNPVFEAAVRDLVDRIQEERDVEREVERGERRRQWSEQWAGDITTALKLNDTQKAKMQEIATQFWERLRELRNSDAGPRPSRQEWRGRMGALRDEAEAKMAQVLDPSQMSSYKGLEEEQRLGGRFGREFRRRGEDNR